MRRACFVIFAAFIVSGSGRAEAASAVAEIEPVTADSTVSGLVYLEETPDGLLVSADISNAPPGKHGFHIHEKGSCADEGRAAGGHYNPAGHDHGDLARDGLEKAHAGDLGNIEIGEDGEGQLEKVLPGLTLREGPYAVEGLAFILHADEDDFGQPAGNAGGRIACGIIEALAVSPPAEEDTARE